MKKIKYLILPGVLFLNFILLQLLCTYPHEQYINFDKLNWLNRDICKSDSNILTMETNKGISCKSLAFQIRSDILKLRYNSTEELEVKLRILLDNSYLSVRTKKTSDKWHNLTFNLDEIYIGKKAIIEVKLLTPKGKKPTNSSISFINKATFYSKNSLPHTIHTYIQKYSLRTPILFFASLDFDHANRANCNKYVNAQLRICFGLVIKREIVGKALKLACFPLLMKLVQHLQKNGIFLCCSITLT